MSKEYILDTSGLKCPLPVLRTQRMLETLNTGDVLKVTATDPASEHDIPSWCNEMGHTVQEVKTDGTIYSFTIIKS